MPILKCTTTFLDGRDRFEAGENLATESGQGCRVITEDQAARFVAAGWASGSGTTLTVIGTTHGQEVRHG